MGTFNGAQVDFYYEEPTMDGTVVPRMVGSSISVPASSAVGKAGR